MLLDRLGQHADGWTLLDHGEAAGVPMAIVPWQALPEALAAVAPDATLGVLVPNTVRAAALVPHLPRLALVAIAFPAFSDGRGFSLARQLRDAGYAGRLRARGPLIADQIVHALACGFDEVEVPDDHAARQPAAQWRAAATAVSALYQRGYRGGPTILDQRRAARRAGGRGTP